MKPEISMVSDKKEIEIYIDGWFMASVDIKNLSPEVKNILKLKKGEKKCQ